LLTARKPPTDRYVLVNHVEEWVHLGSEAVALSTNLYPGAVHPTGYSHCISFSSIPWPTWTYDCNGNTVQREILCVRGRDLVIVRWKLTGTTDVPVVLRARPMLTGRDYHGLHHANESLSTEATIADGSVIWNTYRSLPAVHGFHSGTYRHAPEWYRHVQFPVEQQRGFDCEEDWWSPGEFTFEMKPGKTHTLTFTSEVLDSLGVTGLLSGERARRRRLRTSAPVADPLADAFRQAAETFLVMRESKQTIIAGYPWFTDWGRDTFISLPGLCLVTGRHEVARQIIESFAAHVSEGMVPNRFPDVGEEPEYNTIDASLWFVYAVDRYLAYSRNVMAVRSVAWPAVKQIIDGYRQGTRYAIHMDGDGLMAGGTPGIQLTWMDAKIGDWVVTPRHGKPVEIQALWLKALEIGERLAAQFGEPDYAAHCRTDRARAVQSFRSKFWNEAGGYLYDVIDGVQGNDASIRPNQVYAITLCDDVVTTEQAKQVLQVIKDHLLTPVGLRTLSPQDRRYRPRYEGGPRERDSAYHQGTVWPFLLGPFVTAWLKTYGTSVQRRAEARSFLDGLAAHLQETCVGHVSEIFDGDSPHHPRGCPAQAWSIAEPLRAMVEELGASITTTKA
jgi:predicted glycogen debranching enzyme